MKVVGVQVCIYCNNDLKTDYQKSHYIRQISFNVQKDNINFPIILLGMSNGVYGTFQESAVGSERPGKSLTITFVT
jgi:hypothetical protein